MQPPARRPLSLLDRVEFQRLARRMSDAGIRPNTVSIASVVSIVAGAILLILSPRLRPWPAALCLFAFPLFVLLCSICNLIDGMIAVEEGRRTASGEIYNDFPDRISDPLMFIAAGYAALDPQWGIPLGWGAALASVLVAYTRMLGGAAGAGQYFIGPMAKTHRMLVISVACLGAGIERIVVGGSWSLIVGLGIVIAGCIVTIVRRLGRIVAELETR